MAALKFDVDEGWSWAVCVALFIYGALISGTIKAQGLFLLTYLELFDQSEEATGWIAFALGISITITALVGGYFADVFPHPRKRSTLVVCIILIVVTFALGGYMPNLQLTIVIFTLVGIVIGFQDPLTLSMVSIYFVKWRTVAYGLVMVGAAFGGIAVPLIFEAAREYSGPRGTVLILAGCWMHALFVPAVTWTLPHYPTEVVDKTSNGHVVVQDSKLTVNQDADTNVPVETNTNDNASEEPGCRRNCQKICGILESYKTFLRNPRVPFLLLSMLLALTAYVGGYFLIPLVVNEFGLTDSDISYIFMAASVLDMALKIPVGLLVDKVGISKEAVFLVSIGSYGVGVMILSFINNPYVLYGHALLNGGFAGNTIQLVIPLFVDAAGESQKGTASASIAFLGGTSSAISPVILTAVKTRFGSYVNSLQATAIAAFLSFLFFCGNILIAKIKKCISSKAYDVS